MFTTMEKETPPISKWDSLSTELNRHFQSNFLPTLGLTLFMPTVKWLEQSPLLLAKSTTGCCGRSYGDATGLPISAKWKFHA